MFFSSKINYQAVISLAALSKPEEVSDDKNSLYTRYHRIRFISWACF